MAEAASPLLKTKLFVPRLRSRSVARPRLTERLSDSLSSKLTLISAPPGFGKTALLAEWKTNGSGSSIPLAWVSLDEGDNDPTRFWFYVFTAMDNISAGTGQDALTLLQTGEFVPIQTTLMSFINAVAELPGDCALVLDDYHVIESKTIHDAMAFLLDHMPPQLHVLMATRADPPLPLARLRVQGELVEVRVRDLRFNPVEAAALLAAVPGLELTGAAVEAVSARTEGWVAGLQLAALSLQSRVDLPQFLSDFTGSHQYIVDYLMEEVLQRQSAAVQRFLVRTSILERLTGSLCDAVTETTGGQSMLEMLEHAGLFVASLDGEHGWFRYHQLFADVLRTRLEHLVPDEVPELYARASLWYERTGMLTEAATTALHAVQPDRCAALVEQMTEDLLRVGQVVTLDTLVRNLPVEVVQARPRLCLLYARLQLSKFQYDDMESWLGRTTSVLEHVDLVEGERRDIMGQVRTLEATLVRLRGNAPESIRLGEEAVQLLAADNLIWRSALAVNQAIAYNMMGDLDAGSRALGEATDLCVASGNTALAVPCSCANAELLETKGLLKVSFQTYESALRLDGGRGALMPSSGWAHVGMARLLYERNELADSERHLQEGLDRGRRSMHMDTLIRGFLFQVELRLNQGDLAEAREAKGRLEETLRFLPTPQAAPLLGAVEVRLALAEGDVAAATRLAEACGPTDPSMGPIAIPPSLLSRLLCAQGQAAQAVRFLSARAEAVHTAGRAGVVLSILVPLTVAQHASGDLPAALSTLARALVIGEREGFLRVFADEGRNLAVLLHHAIRRGSGSPYMDRILAAMGDATGEEPATEALAGRALAEPLSEREIEVLHLLAAGLSNQEIADQAYIAVGTVKRHVHNILGKLGAADRAEAVARAREFHLL